MEKKIIKNLNFAAAISKLLEPIFRDLSSDTLLQKCTHSQTQNVNKASNQILLPKCPKEVLLGRDTLELAL